MYMWDGSSHAFQKDHDYHIPGIEAMPGALHTVRYKQCPINFTQRSFPLLNLLRQAFGLLPSHFLLCV